VVALINCVLENVRKRQLDHTATLLAHSMASIHRNHSGPPFAVFRTDSVDIDTAPCLSHYLG
jgi:hypothetical protein